MNKKQYKIITKGVADWNKWRKTNPGAYINLNNANLARFHLAGANLIRANLSRANLTEARLRGANLAGACLTGANLTRADLIGANLISVNLSNAVGLISPFEWMESNFEKTCTGYIVYKAFGNTPYNSMVWGNPKKGKTISEVVNPCRTDNCGCGVNFATEEWVISNYFGYKTQIWQMLLRWKWLSTLVVPYNTDGKARCGILECVKQYNAGE